MWFCVRLWIFHICGGLFMSSDDYVFADHWEKQHNSQERWLGNCSCLNVSIHHRINRMGLQPPHRAPVRTRDGKLRCSIASHKLASGTWISAPMRCRVFQHFFEGHYLKSISTINIETMFGYDDTIETYWNPGAFWTCQLSLTIGFLTHRGVADNKNLPLTTITITISIHH